MFRETKTRTVARVVTMVLAMVARQRCDPRLGPGRAILGRHKPALGGAHIFLGETELDPMRCSRWGGMKYL